MAKSKVKAKADVSSKKKVKKGKKTERILVTTPVGRILYPFLHKVDEGREYSDGKYKVDLLLPKELFVKPKKEADDTKQMKAARELRKIILKVGRKHFQDDDLKLGDFKNPLLDGDEKKKQEFMKGHYVIRAKTEFQPSVVDKSQDDLPEKQVEKLKSGDFARLVLSIFPYSQGEGGVSAGLQLVQFAHTGKALGGGKAASLKLLDKLEVDLGDINMDDIEEEDEEEDEDTETEDTESDDDEDSDDDSDDNADEADDDSDDDESDEDESDDSDDEEEESDDDSDEEEDEAPKKRGRPKKEKKPEKSAKANGKAVKNKKKKKSRDEDDDMDDDSDDDVTDIRL